MVQWLQLGWSPCSSTDFLGDLEQIRVSVPWILT